MSIPIRVVHTQNHELIRDVGRARLKAWLDSDVKLDQHLIDQGTWLEELDFSPDCHHFIAYQGDTIVGAARVTIHNSDQQIPFISEIRDIYPELPLPCLSFNRLFVSPEARNHGIGGLLHLQRLQWSASQPVKMILVPALGEERRDSLLLQGFIDRGVINTDRYYATPNRKKTFFLTVKPSDVKLLNVPARVRHELSRSDSGVRSVPASGY